MRPRLHQHEIDRRTLSDVKARVHTDGPQKLVAVVKDRLRSGFKHPEIALLVYIDEVYDLSTIFCHDERSRNVYETLLDAFNDLGPENPIFLVTITTNPAVLRRTSPMRHQTPYTELVFDCPLDGRRLFYPRTLTQTFFCSCHPRVPMVKKFTRWKLSSSASLLASICATEWDFHSLKFTLVFRVTKTNWKDPWIASLRGLRMGSVSSEG